MLLNPAMRPNAYSPTVKTTCFSKTSPSEMSRQMTASFAHSKQEQEKETQQKVFRNGIGAVSLSALAFQILWVRGRRARNLRRRAPARHSLLFSERPRKSSRVQMEQSDIGQILEQDFKEGLLNCHEFKKQNSQDDQEQLNRDLLQDMLYLAIKLLRKDRRRSAKSALAHAHESGELEKLLSLGGDGAVLTAAKELLEQCLSRYKAWLKSLDTASIYQLAPVVSRDIMMEVDPKDGQPIFVLVDYALTPKPESRLCSGSDRSSHERHWKRLKEEAQNLVQSEEFNMDVSPSGARIGMRLMYLGEEIDSRSSELRIFDLDADALEAVKRSEAKEADWSAMRQYFAAQDLQRQTLSSEIREQIAVMQKDDGSTKRPKRKGKKKAEAEILPEPSATSGVLQKTIAGETLMWERVQEILASDVHSASASASDADENSAVAVTKGTTIVRSKAEAERVLKILLSLRGPQRFHALDTETRNWKPGLSPYGHGEVICWSIYCGDDVDFGSGPRLWIDNMGEDGVLRGFVEFFKEYLEDPGIQKVFQNYAFDRAIFFNHGCTIQGFAGDTMHMARLEHSERDSYSLESLGDECLGAEWRKTSLLKLMSEEKAKTPDALQKSKKAETVAAWVEYSCFDTVVTWKLHDHLRTELSHMFVHESSQTLLEFYCTYWRPLADVLVGIEERGVPFDTEHLQRMELIAKEDLQIQHRAFKDFLRDTYEKLYPDDEQLGEAAVEMFNPGSTKQMRHFVLGTGKQIVSGVPIGGLGLQLAQTPKSLGQNELTQICGEDPENGQFGTGYEQLGEEGCRGLAHRTKAGLITKALTSFLVPLQAAVDENGRIHTTLNIRTRTGRLSSSNPNLQQMPAMGTDRYNVRKAIRCEPGKSFVIADYGQLDLRVLAHLSGGGRMVDCLCSGVDLHSGTAFHMYDHIQKAVELGKVSLEGGDGIPAIKDVYGEERRHAKAVNFGIAYGLTAAGLSNQLQCTKEAAQEMVDKWHGAYPEVKKWQNKVLTKAKEYKRLNPGASDPPYVETPRGRRRHLPGLQASEPGSRYSQYNSNGKRLTWRDRVMNKDAAAASGRAGQDARWAHICATRQGINSPVQGGSADIVVEAMLKADQDPRLRDLGYRMILQIHDELIFEGPTENADEALRLVTEIMQNPFLDDTCLLVPLPVDAKVEQNWHDAKN
eukprot:TRINITY_DN79179_c0_g1_i1.p1 TRINITY_DN79179_c0_g1~~TRINITY_DN79179_c0_g1_i1.p1  ORF type:complete len:1175 (+),score=249.68 TRINITY_DN79179_c0_g1_i1:211-3735(+)